MPPASVEDCIDQIGRLVAFPTVSSESNIALIDYAKAHLEAHGFTCRTLPNAEGTKASLWASIGPADVPGVILSGHSDVVPVSGQNWASDPFTLRQSGGRLYGRGTADMKGFVGIMLATAPALARRDLKAPVHFAISYDEEVGCTGVGDMAEMIAGLTVRPALCIVGEPTSMELVTAHKGCGLYRVTVTGREAHSSLAPQTVNCLEIAADLMRDAKAIAAELAAGPSDDGFDVPHSTLSITSIEGGEALNIVPGRCTFTFDIRALPGLDVAGIVARLSARGDALIEKARAKVPEARIDIEKCANVLAFDTPPGHPVNTFMRGLLRTNGATKVAYGTEAGIFSTIAGVPSLVCGPGSIVQAHKPDEYLDISQITECLNMLEALFQSLERTPSAWDHVIDPKV